MWNVALQLADHDEPLFRRIATTIASDITRGRLLAGSKLPSSRALARQLGVNRNTVVTAYDELSVRGWITIEATRGAFVHGVPGTRDDLIAGNAPRAGFACEAGYDLEDHRRLPASTPRDGSMLILYGGVPDLGSLPLPELARAYRAALMGPRARALLDYADPRGSLRLREALADLMRGARGIAASPEAITVVRGGRQALYVVAQTLIRPGDVVAVEALGYRPAWRALELAGARLVPIPVDREGLDVSALSALEGPIRAVYTTPHHHYPTTVTMSPARRAQLLALARTRRIAVIEDDYDFDVHYAGRPVLPLAASDHSGNVIYVGTLSKTLAPGIRIGFIVAPPPVAHQLAIRRAEIDTQGDHVLEYALASLFEDGVIQRYTRKMQRVYRARRDVFVAALQRELPQLELDVPRGGMAIWARAPGVDTDAWVERARAAGVAFQAGRQFRFDGAASEFVRLGFAACSEAELVEAAARMRRVVD